MKRRTWFVAWVGVWAALASGGIAGAAEEAGGIRIPRWKPQLEASFFHVAEAKPAGLLMGAWVVDPFLGRGLWTGPRAGVLLGKGREGEVRVDLQAGLEATLWMVNALGPGVAGDWVIPSQASREGSSYFRGEGFVAFRLKHLGDDGALGGRVGPFIDSRDHWGFKIGLLFQFSGIPQYGRVAE